MFQNAWNPRGHLDSDIDWIGIKVLSAAFKFVTALSAISVLNELPKRNTGEDSPIILLTINSIQRIATLTGAHFAFEVTVA